MANKLKKSPAEPEITRLVNVISNLETVIVEMKSKLDECFTVIKSQELILTSQKIEIDYIKKILTNNSPENKNHDKFNIPPKLLLRNHVSLNQSGPTGLNYMPDLDSSYDDVAEILTVSPQKPTLASRSGSAPNSPSYSSVVAALKVPKAPAPADGAPTVPVVSAPAAAVPAAAEPVAAATLSATARTAGASAAAPVTILAQTAAAPAAAVQATRRLRSRAHRLSPVVDPPSKPSPSVSQSSSQLSSRTSTCGLKAASPRVISWHVFNLSEGTTVSDVIHYVETELKIRDAKCEQLKVTRGQYSSFRLDVPAANTFIIKQHTSWPEGVSVRRFKIVQSNSKNFHHHASSTVKK